MRRNAAKQTAILAGMGLLALGGSPVAATIGPEASAATPRQPAAVCATSSPSFQQIASLHKVGESDFQCLGVSLENGAIKGIRLETHHFNATDPPSALEQVKVEDFPQAALESDRGAVLDGIPGHDAIVLRGHFTTPSHQLALVASFLYNGFTDDYHGCEIAIVRSPDSGWHLVDRFNQTIFDIVVQTRKFPLIGDFGIANLDGACS